MVFSLSCTSAACERVFSLVDAMYGRDQLCVLGDQLQAAVMLQYNKRMKGMVGIHSCRVFVIKL